MSGVKVWRSTWEGKTFPPNYSEIKYTHPGFVSEPGLWYTEAEAAALEAVAEAARKPHASGWVAQGLTDALDTLDAARRAS